METKDKRVKREIANSNERRRMQSINAGFQRLKRLLPVDTGEKLSKANILQHAAEFIQRIEREKHLLHEQNTLFRGTILAIKSGTPIDNLDLDALPIIPLNAKTITDTATHNTKSDEIIKIEKHASNNNNNVIDKIEPVSRNHEVVISTSDRVACPKSGPVSTGVASPKNNLVSTGVAKAAIALPLEVPYISETESKELGPKGQTLDTICKAIMEIEGRSKEMETQLK